MLTAAAASRSVVPAMRCRAARAWPDRRARPRTAAPIAADRRAPCLMGQFDLLRSLAQHGRRAGVARQHRGRGQSAAWRRSPGTRGTIKLWVGLGNALTDHARTLTPAAAWPIGRAAELAPGYPAPPFFLGLADGPLGQSRRSAFALWRAILADAPANASWRPMIEDGLSLMTQRAPAPRPAKRQAGS